MARRFVFPHPGKLFCILLALFVVLAPSIGNIDSVDDDEVDEGVEEEDAEEGPAQMTQEWWDVHYRKIVGGDWKVMGDPRERGSLTPLRGLTDQRHFYMALACAESLLPNSTVQAATVTHKGRPFRRHTKVLLLGCGLSSLIFALADQSNAKVFCLELSEMLVNNLNWVALSVPKAPKFLVGDITAIAQRRRARRPNRHGAVKGLAPRSFDLVIDENVIDGMACRFPPSASTAAVRMALDGIRLLLRPGGRLLTVSFVPLHRLPYSTAFVDWEQSGMPCEQPTGKDVHLATWAVLPEIASSLPAAAT